MSNDTLHKIYQFKRKKRKYPVFIKVDQEFLNETNTEFLLGQLFEELDQNSFKKELEENKSPHLRILNLIKPSAGVKSQIGKAREFDKFGEESIQTKNGFQIYKFKGIGVMVYSYACQEWEMALDLPQEDLTLKTAAPFKVAINRFLSRTLVPFGVLGLWGTKLEDGILVDNYLATDGEAVFVDMINKKIYFSDCDVDVEKGLTIYRHENLIHSQNRHMKREELLGFLMTRVCYFDKSGASVPVRQMISELTKISFGIVGNLFQKDEVVKKETEGDLSL